MLCNRMTRSRSTRLTLIILLVGFLPYYSLFARHNPLRNRLQKNSHVLQYFNEASAPDQSMVLCQSSSAATAINIAATSAISKLMSVCGIGYCAGRAGLLDQNAVSVLSKLVFSLIQPCFIFVQVTGSISKQAEQGLNASLMLLPLMAALQVALGFLVGSLVSKILYPKKQSSDDMKQLLACTTFGNSGPLPIVFTDAIFSSHSDRTLLKKGMAYISLYLLGWSPMFWIVGPAILADPNNSTAPQSAVEKRKQLFKRVFNPPVIASIFGLICGCSRSLSSLFVPPSSLFNPIYEAASTLGNAYLPCVLLILSGSLTATAAPSTSSTSSPSSAASSTSVPAKGSSFEQLLSKIESNKEFATEVFAVYLAKFLVMPSISFLLVALLNRHVPAAAQLFRTDPMLLYVLLLETCMPSAQNLTVILQLQGKKKAATRLARVLMIIYFFGVPAITYWLVRILHLTKLF